jgi:hypothetical protein
MTDVDAIVLFVDGIFIGWILRVYITRRWSR